MVNTACDQQVWSHCWPHFSPHFRCYQPTKLKTPVGTFSDGDVLEGFAADAEYLGRDRGEPDIYDNEFYRLCKADNSYIFEFKGENTVRIPPKTLSTFEDIIFKKMKRGKVIGYEQCRYHVDEFIRF